MEMSIDLFVRLQSPISGIVKRKRKSIKGFIISVAKTDKVDSARSPLDIVNQWRFYICAQARYVVTSNDSQFNHERLNVVLTGMMAYN